MVSAELADELTQVEALKTEWDDLAIACRAPVAGPAWALAWWRYVAPAGLGLRVVAVREHRRLVGLVPLYVEPSRVVAYRLLANSYASALTPLAIPGREHEVATAAAHLLNDAEPRPDRVDLGPVPAFSPWAEAFREHWPTRMRPLSLRTRSQTVATIDIEGRTFDEWLAERDSRMRANGRRRQRRFTELGGTYRYATAASLRADLNRYAALHALRWVERGQSRYLALGERLIPFFEAVAGDLIGQHRFRLLMLELGGEPICAEISLCAGGEVASLTAGWDPRHGRLSPARLALLYSIEEACRLGERRIDLSWGNLEYKQEYANAVDAVVWDSLVVPSTRLVRSLPPALPAVANRRLRESLKRVLSDAQINRVRSLRERLT